MARSSIVAKTDVINRHQQIAGKLKRWIGDYQATVDEADTLARWCDHGNPSVPEEAVGHAIRFMERDLEGLLKNLDRFIVEVKAES